MRSAIGKYGFTLVELMIVVAIVGILAVLATVGVRHYIGSSKSAEARNALGAIAADAAAAFDRERNTQQPVFAGQASGPSKRLCSSSSASVPASIASVSGRKYQSTVAEWNVDAPAAGGFACLGFAINQAQYYMYSYAVGGTGTAIGDTFTAMAQGDLGGTGATSVYTLTGAIASSLVVNLAPAVATRCTGSDCPDL